MMTTEKIIAVLSIITIALSIMAMNDRAIGIGKPMFDNKTTFSPSLDSDATDVQVFLSIPYAGLQFIKCRPVYRARFEVLTAIYREDRLISKTHRNDSVDVESYRETNSLENFAPEAYILKSIEPGEFRLFISVVDLESKQEYSRSADIIVPSFSNDSLPQFGSLILIDVDGIRPFNYDFYPVGDSIYFKTTVAVPEGRTSIISFGIEESGELLFSDTAGTMANVVELRFSAPIPKDVGRFSIFVSAKSSSGSPVRVDKEVRIASDRYRHYGSDKKELVEQLKILEDGPEVDFIEDAICDEPEKIDSLVKLFWKNRDPTPNTELNELREEFYRRIAIANARFYGTPDGWRSDMGRIYILYGEPDDIDKHPFDIGYVAYEIWYFYNPRMTFYFEDRHGIGNYELVRQE